MKNLIMLLTIFFISTALLAQNNSAALKIGHFSPAATEGGFIIGYEGGKFVDRNVIIGWSIDWFHRSYVDKALVGEFNSIYGLPSGTINELRAKTNLHDIPLMITATGYFPVGRRIAAYVTGGIGAEVLLIFYRNFENPNEDEFQGAFDFNWRIGFGTVFQMGPRSDIFAEVVYHSSQPSWEYEVEDRRMGITRIFEREFDMSGLMGRFGVRFFF